MWYFVSKRIFSLVLVTFVFCALLEEIKCENRKEIDVAQAGRELVQQGRTFVHHAVKRFMVILPAIFFKLGIAFTLLVLVALVAVNNGFIGFLILVVGLSSVLARLQQGQHPPAAVPVPIYGLPHHGHPFIDRSDDSPVYVKTNRHSGVVYPKEDEVYQQRIKDKNEGNAYAAQISRLNDLLLQNQYAQNVANYGNTQAVYGSYAPSA